MCMLAHLQTVKIDKSVKDVLRMFLQKDHAAHNIMNLAKASKTRRFWIEEDLLVTKGNRLYVPRARDLRKRLLHECYDTLWAGHPGWQQTYALLKKGYFWPNMKDDFMQYTKTCLIRQQNRVEKVKVVGLLDSLSIPTRPWESVSGLHYSFFQGRWLWGHLGHHRSIFKVHHFHSHYQAVLSWIDNSVVLQACC